MVVVVVEYNPKGTFNISSGEPIGVDPSSSSLYGTLFRLRFVLFPFSGLDSLEFVTYCPLLPGENKKEEIRKKLNKEENNIIEDIEENIEEGEESNEDEEESTDHLHNNTLIDSETFNFQGNNQSQQFKSPKIYRSILFIFIIYFLFY